jgi:hypothetical protein
MNHRSGRILKEVKRKQHEMEAEDSLSPSKHFGNPNTWAAVEGKAMDG